MPDAGDIFGTLANAADAHAGWSPILAKCVYILCTLTCMVCAVLLGMGYLRTRAGLLFWSSLCFIGLTLNNLLLFLDLVVFPNVDLGPLRDWTALAAMIVLVFGLIWNTD